VHALATAVLAAALVASPAALPPSHTVRHTTRLHQQSLEGRKGVTTLPSAVTQRYVLTLPGSPLPVIGLHESYAGRDNPAPAGPSTPPSPGMIVLLAALALVGAGVLMTAPRWLRGR
jgi:hypothetical protein